MTRAILIPCQYCGAPQTRRKQAAATCYRCRKQREKRHAAFAAEVQRETAAVEPPPRPANVFEAIERQGHDEDFEPAPKLVPMRSPPGTALRVDELAAAVRAGVDLWHAEDATFEDLTQTQENA
jgi:hypothetical protein